jgi:glycosyltransferase involved in cell wall biosynthesis
MTLGITVIVCAHNEERTLPACLHALLAQNPASRRAAGHQQCEHR